MPAICYPVELESPYCTDDLLQDDDGILACSRVHKKETQTPFMMMIFSPIPLVVILGLVLLASKPYIIVAVSSAIPSAAAAASSSYSGNIFHQDLSFQYHVDQETIIEKVKLQLLQEQKGATELSLDVSNCNLGDNGLFQLLQCFQNNTTAGSNNTRITLIRLEARMNQITSLGFVNMIQELLLTSTNARINTTTNATNYDNTSTVEVLLQGEKGQSTTNTNGTNSNTSAINLSDKENDDNIPNVNSNDRDYKLSKISPTYPSYYIQLLDLAWNPIGGGGYEGTGLPNMSNKKLLKSIRELIQSIYCCPETLHLEQCGISVGFCRAIGKGLINHYHNQNITSIRQCTLDPHRHSLRNLHLMGNPEVGDAGTAAIAAALRTVGTTTSTSKDSSDNDETYQHYILQVLDLSSCNIGDAGAEALAVALADGNNIIQHLDLSNNDISDHGAISIANALIQAARRRKKRSYGRCFGLSSICLDNNPQIGDSGATALASCIQSGILKKVSLRSCSIQAKGVGAFGKALFELSASSSSSNSFHESIHLDFSGNKFGIFKPKKKKRTSSISDYAATKAAYFSQKLSSTLQGVRRSSVAFLGEGTTDSDAEEDDDVNHDDEKNMDARIRAISSPCGARSFADPFVTNTSIRSNTTTNTPRFLLPCFIGMRHCALDQGAVDALAASVLCAKEYYNLNLTLDVALNSHLDDYWRTDPLKTDSPLLSEMAHRYIETIEAMKISQERAKALERVFTDRQRAEAAFDDVLSSSYGDENNNSDDYMEEPMEFEEITVEEEMLSEEYAEEEEVLSEESFDEELSHSSSSEEQV